MRRASTAVSGALAALIGYAAFAAGARAEEPSLAPALGLTWKAPVACPDEGSVRARIATLLAGSSATIEARAEARRSGERWQVVLVMNGGERRLEADSCFALADATALIVAMAADPARVAANRMSADAGAPPLADASPAVSTDAESRDAEVDAAAPVAAPPPPVAALPPPALPPPRLVPASSSPSSLLRFAVSASASLDFGLLPSVAPGPSLAAAWIPPGPFRVDLTASYFPPTRTLTITPPPGSASPTGTAQFWLFDTLLRLCYLAKPGPFELGPCAGAQFGTLQGSSRGIDTPGSGSLLIFAFDAGFLASWRFAQAWAFFARGDVALQTQHEPFGVTSGAADETIYNPGSVTGRASAGVELRF